MRRIKFIIFVMLYTISLSSILSAAEIKTKPAFDITKPYEVIFDPTQKGVITKKCTSPSGASHYDLSLDLTNNKGEIRYRYMKQDIFYKVAIQEKGTKIKGIAIFDRSSTGEKKGNPFNFEYSMEDNTFTELNIKSNCD